MAGASSECFQSIIILLYLCRFRNELYSIMYQFGLDVYILYLCTGLEMNCTVMSISLETTGMNRCNYFITNMEKINSNGLRL